MRLFKCIVILIFILGTNESFAQEANPNEKLEYLIGQWKIELKSMNIDAYMNFEWGPDKTYILSTNKNILDGKESHENTSMIAWDGVEGKFVITQVYHGEGSLLVGRGTIEVNGDLISRDITLHYAPYQYVPFLKRKAPKEGEVLEYRQRWKIVDDNTFTGHMEALIDNVWKSPFGDNPEEEKWVKVK